MSVAPLPSIGPLLQAAAAAEVAAVLGGQAVTPSDAFSLPYVEAVVLEALRLYPPAYLVGRCAAQATTLAGYSLPAGGEYGGSRGGWNLLQTFYLKRYGRGAKWMQPA